MADKEIPKIVPPRNDLKKVEVYAKSRALELAGQDPESTYQYMSVDPKNPDYYEKFTRRHEIGDPESGYAMCEPWEFVSSTDGVTTGRPRDDQGKPVDTAIRHGDLVLMKTTKANRAVYEHIEHLKDAAQTSRLRRDDKTYNDGSGVARHNHRFGYGFLGSHTDLLNQSQGA